MKRINNVDRLFMAFVITLGIFCMPSCEKEPDKPAGGNKIEVSATSIEAVTYSFGDLEATISGYDSNNVNITNHGFYWSTIPDPDLNSSLVELGRRNKFGSFNTRLSDLDENKKYYVRAFANIPGGTIRGPSTEFTTLERGPAVVKIDSLSSIMGNSASCFSSVLSDGGYDVTARGVCWNTTGNPTLQNCINFTSDGIGIGSFTSNITGLSPSTTYFVRAYATNSEGTAYDVDDVSFTILTPWSCGATLGITHTAGAIAPVNKTVNYGTVQTNLTGSNKCWITQNLGADRQAISATDDTEASAGWYWQFNRRQGFKHDGMVRTPNTAWISSIIENSEWIQGNDPCKLLLGNEWRLPTRTEWESVNLSEGWTNYFNTYASDLKMHTAGYLYYLDGVIGNHGYSGYYWGSTQSDDEHGWYLDFNNSHSYVGETKKAFGFPARCLRD
jgi:hypothetical protein